MRKKKMTTVLCAAAVLCLFAGCGQGGQVSQNSASFAETEGQVKYTEQNSGVGELGNGGQTAETAPDSGGKDVAESEGIDLRELTSTSGGNAWCMSESGYYYITEEGEELKDGAWGSHIMYMDFAARQEVYLCSSAGCRHDTADCSSVLSKDDFAGDPIIFYFDNMLYVMARDYDKDGATVTEMVISDDGSTQPPETETVPAALYRMKPDGTERTKVYEFKAGATVEELAYGSGEDLYFITKKLKTETEGNTTYTTSTHRELVKISTASWKAETVYSFEENKRGDSWRVIGCAGRRLVLQRTVYDHERTEDEIRAEGKDDDLWKKNFENTKEEFAALDLAEGALKTVYTSDNHLDILRSCAVGNGKLYLSWENDPALYQVNLDTGEKRKFTELKQNNIWGVYGDQLLCSTWDLADDHTWYFVSVKDGSVHHCTLTIPANGWALEIRGRVGDQYFLVYDYDCQRDALDPEVYEINQYKYALIDKEDLYHSKANYHPI